MGTTDRLWHHSPSHRFVAGATYFVTAATCGKAPFFKGDARLARLREALFSEAMRFGWNLAAWALFANHYHLVALAPEDASTLSALIRSVHSKTAIAVNKLDATPGRRVWIQYRDTCLTSEKSYFARLNYTHRNPARHGVVKDAREYRWCSMAWFLETSEAGFRKTVLAFDESKVEIQDDF